MNRKFTERTERTAFGKSRLTMFERRRFIGVSLGILGVILGFSTISGRNSSQTQSSVTSQDWSQVSTTTLSERQHSSVAFNEAMSQLIVFGGDNTVNVVNDTWAFDGMRWNRLQPPQSASPRTDASMVYFPVTGTLILFGGDTHTAPDGLRNGTWTFDGNTWTALNPVHRPPARYGASLAYNPIDKELVLFGGEGENGTLGDTWTFDGTDWTERPSTTAPSERYGAVMAYDSVSTAVILFGGLGFNSVCSSAYESDTWAWKDHRWTQLSPA